jgi:hypothetical protein
MNQNRGEAREASTMNMHNRAESIIRDMERVAPYMYEGLYGSFLRTFMESDRSKWTEDLSKYIGSVNQEWADVGEEIADILWEEFEDRISC